MRFPLADVRFNQNLGDALWPSRCDIHNAGFAGDGASVYEYPAGESAILPADSGNVFLEQLPCRLGPFIDTRNTDNEQRGLEVVGTVLRRTLKLNGFYPMIVPREMAAIVDGAYYFIRGVEHDSESRFTRCLLERVNPNNATTY